MTATLGEWIRRAGRKLLLVLTERRVIEGMDVRLQPLDKGEVLLVWPKVEEALAYLRYYWPAGMQRLRDNVRTVYLEKTYGGNHGEWHHHGRTMSISVEHVLSPGTHPVHLAAIIVHESTHGWLDALGFEYRTDHRHRIEAICFRAMAAFTRRIPQCERLTEFYEERAAWALDPANLTWSDAELRERWRASGLVFSAEMRAEGWPEVLTKALESRLKRDSA